MKRLKKIGVVDPDTGFASFTITVSAIVCRPFKGEVCDLKRLFVLTVVSQHQINNFLCR
jgi:hypothetical protein